MCSKLNLKMQALSAYVKEREMGKNPDMTPYVCSHEVYMAFLNGWDKCLESIEKRIEQ